MRRAIEAATWWHNLGNAFENVCRQFIGKAQKAELSTHGHECGHRFEITIRSSLHVSGPDKHTDADWWSDQRPVTVRAHNLRDALLIAATLPLSDWFEDDEEPVSRPGSTSAGEPS
ncbi:MULTISPECIES: hypothetical protein [unclassified Nocardioides]|uniref:hypothetical protein n=1 Tax=unclassified Nocardioides TaxID=2615069 RepID=UPI0009F07803|nr:MULTISPECIES: hypothetical protein [unclassified Nocardioides]GAW50580.1 hypothetical protein PD653B2_2916 [Nocardioides sp. PD653-B2]GAW57465.1 hypothetical protein PD653_4910 [Nocardioides sp. PD653]